MRFGVALDLWRKTDSTEWQAERQAVAVQEAPVEASEQQRDAQHRARATNAATPASDADVARGRLREACTELGVDLQRAVQMFAEVYDGAELRTSADAIGIDSFTQQLRDKAKAGVL